MERSFPITIQGPEEPSISEAHHCRAWERPLVQASPRRPSPLTRALCGNYRGLCGSLSEVQARINRLPCIFVQIILVPHTGCTGKV